MEPVYQCRHRRGIVLLLWGVGVAFAASLGEPRWLAGLFVAVLTLLALQSVRAPLLRVYRDRLEYRPWFPGPAPFRRGSLGETLRQSLRVSARVVRGEDVARLAWDGTDNVGIRMKDGRLECVSFYLAHPAERATARQRILEFVERFSGGAPQAA